MMFLWESQEFISNLKTQNDFSSYKTVVSLYVNNSKISTEKIELGSVVDQSKNLYFYQYRISKA